MKMVLKNELVTNFKVLNLCSIMRRWCKLYLKGSKLCFVLLLFGRKSHIKAIFKSHSKLKYGLQDTQVLALLRNILPVANHMQWSRNEKINLGKKGFRLDYTVFKLRILFHGERKILKQARRKKNRIFCTHNTLNNIHNRLIRI